MVAELPGRHGAHRPHGSPPCGHSPTARVRLSLRDRWARSPRSPPAGSCWRCRSRRCATSTSARPGCAPVTRAGDRRARARRQRQAAPRRAPAAVGRAGLRRRGLHERRPGFQCGWDDTADQPLPGGVLNLFPGGSQVSAGWTGPAFGVPAATPGAAPTSRRSSRSSPAQRRPTPGSPTATSGTPTRGAKGAYTAQRPGQYTTGVRRRVDARGQHPLRRRAHQHGVLRLPQRRGRVGRAGGQGHRPVLTCPTERLIGSG